VVALLALAVLAQPEVLLGGQKQVVFGLKPEPSLILSYYIWIEDKPNDYGSSTNVYAQRLGYTGSRVKYDVFNNQRVYCFETDGRTKKDYKKEFDTGVLATEKAWIDPETGHILRQIFTVEMPKTGERIVEAIYGTKTVELSIKEGGKETTTTLYPDGGCQPFFERFKPMVVDGKVVLKEKNFLVLNPYTLSFVKGSATVGGRFDGTILLKRMQGNLYNIFIDGQRQRVYITDKKDLVKIDITDTTYFQVDSVPDSMLPGGVGGGRN
jgi:hypothetical protein